MPWVVVNGGRCRSIHTYGRASGRDTPLELSLQRVEQSLPLRGGASADHALFAKLVRNLAAFGMAVSSAGDVNADGYDDVIVGSYLDADTAVNGGSVYVYLGGASGIDLSTELEFTGADVASGTNFGRSVSPAGDVNGDGYDDVVVGSSVSTSNSKDRGAAYVYFGSASGIDVTTETQLVDSSENWMEYYGWAVSGAGDLDNDGYDDLIVGELLDANNGSAFIHYGSATGVDATRYDVLTASDGASQDRFGAAVAAAGDLDGDGYDDVVVGAYSDDIAGSDEGSLYAYYGSSSGIDLTREDKLTASDGATNDRLGFSVAGAGDLDGDGYDDIVAGAYRHAHTTGGGAAYVYYGSATGVDIDTEQKVTATNTTLSQQFGYSVSGVGDVDGDGYGDVVVGDNSEDNADGVGTGGALLYHGGPEGLDTDRESRVWASDGAAGDNFGQAVAGAGDVDGDGLDDLIIGAPSDQDAGSWTGAAYVYPGCDEDPTIVAVTGSAGGVVRVWVSGACAGTTVRFYTGLPGTSHISSPCDMVEETCDASNVIYKTL